MRVDVTDDDIRDGERCNCNRCPIALAVSRAIGAGTSVTAGSSYIWLDTLRIRTPDAARAFILRFDLGETVHPFTFKLPAGEDS